MCGETKSRFAAISIVFVALIAAIMMSTPSFAQMNSDLFGTGGGEEEKIVEVSSVLSVTSASSGNAYSAAVVVDIGDEWHINAAIVKQEDLIPARVTFDTIAGFTPTGIVYPDGFDFPFFDETLSVYGGRTVIPFAVKIGSDVAPGEYVLPVRIRYQPCNDKTCLAPKTEEIPLSITVGNEGAAAHTDIFGAIEEKPEPTPPPVESAEPESEIQRLIDEHGFWGYFIALGLAFVTGLLLSFSPCTYPMIPITVSIFAGQERSVGRGFILSLFYVGSMAMVYGIMGLIVSLVGGVFGAWLASTPVVIGIAIVFVIFALSMFGLYELQVPAWLRSKLGARKSGGGVLGSIVLGIVAALVVSPCVGPFVAGILLYIATAGSPLLGFVVLFVFALGLGTLFVIIGTFSSAINALPGSGGWMESVKKFFGFVLILMAIYFLETIIPTEVTALLTGLLLLSFAVFGGGFDRLTSESGFFDRLKKFLGVLAFILGFYLLLGTVIMQGFILPPASLNFGGGVGTSEKAELIPWEKDLDRGLARAASENKPVLIDTWATWCVNCKVLDKKTFGNADVAREADRFVPIKVQLEEANSDITKDFMKRFGLTHFSLPTTLLLNSGGRVLKVMQGVVGPEEMIAEMRKAAQ